MPTPLLYRLLLALIALAALIAFLFFARQLATSKTSIPALAGGGAVAIAIGAFYALLNELGKQQ